MLCVYVCQSNGNYDIQIGKAIMCMCVYVYSFMMSKNASIRNGNWIKKLISSEYSYKHITNPKPNQLIVWIVRLKEKKTGRVWRFVFFLVWMKCSYEWRECDVDHMKWTKINKMVATTFQFLMTKMVVHFQMDTILNAIVSIGIYLIFQFVI